MNLKSTSVFSTEPDVSEVEIYSKLEAAGFPPDEKASTETILYRVTNAPNYFRVVRLKHDQTIIGFINGTCIESATLTDESMSTHNPLGRTLIIHSVLVHPDHQRRGIATAMLKDYVAHVSTILEVDRILLLSKSHLLHFYISCGFRVIRLSPVEHGKDQWFELGLDLSEYRQIDQLQIDAFALTPFSGNPAAVIFLHREDDWMQRVAAENNLSETAFLQEITDQENHFYLRWFTPAVEVELCGHATLASAHALYSTHRVKPLTEITFHTKYRGTLKAKGLADGTVEMDFPSDPPKAVTLTEREKEFLLRGLVGLQWEDVVFVGRSTDDLLVEISQNAFSLLGEIDFGHIRLLGGRGVVVTCVGSKQNNFKLDSDLEGKFKGDDVVAKRRKILLSNVQNQSFDFVSRGFFPCYGIDEDPVTGSAHCMLTPYWFSKLNPTIGETRLTGYQGCSRGGVVMVELRNSATGDSRVSLAGPCITVMKTKIVV